MKHVHEQLKDEQIFAIPEYRRLYILCNTCRCAMCAHWRYECRTCALCMREAHPFTRCNNFEPFVFSREPYISFIAELDELKEERKFYID